MGMIRSSNSFGGVQVVDVQKVAGSNPAPATSLLACCRRSLSRFGFIFRGGDFFLMALFFVSAACLGGRIFWAALDLAVGF